MLLLKSAPEDSISTNFDSAVVPDNDFDIAVFKDLLSISQFKLNFIIESRYVDR